MMSSIKEKLNGMGILGEPLDWISSYLKDRQHIVRIKHMGSDGLTSLYRSNVSPDMNTGIPQGSNLGPVLFFVHVNILPESLFDIFGCLQMIFKPLAAGQQQRILKK